MFETLCDTPGCGKPSKLRCPTCVQKDIQGGSNFCNQVTAFLKLTLNLFLKISQRSQPKNLTKNKLNIFNYLNL